MQDVKLSVQMPGLTPPLRGHEVKLDLTAGAAVATVEVKEGTLRGLDGEQCAVYGWTAHFFLSQIRR